MARDSFSSSRLTWPFFSLKQLSSSQEAMSLANRKTKMTFRDQFSPLARHIERWRSRVQQVYGQGSKALAFASLPCPATSLPWCVCGGLGPLHQEGQENPRWVLGPGSFQGSQRTNRVLALLGHSTLARPSSCHRNSQSKVLSTIAGHSHGKSAESRGQPHSNRLQLPL